MSERHGVLMVFYDLPTNTSTERTAYAHFRKKLLQTGFIMMQKSVYVKLLRNVSQEDRETKSVRKYAPELGTIHVITLSMNEFKSFITIQGDLFNMELFANDMIWA